MIVEEKPGGSGMLAFLGLGEGFCWSSRTHDGGGGLEVFASAMVTAMQCNRLLIKIRRGVVSISLRINVGLTY